MRAIGIAIPFFRRRSGVPIDAQAQVHYNRVIADGGVVPSGLSGVNAFFSAVKAIYGTSDINTAISAAYDAHYLGYKLGAGSGTTLGQAAQKLYSATMGANLITFTDNLAQTYWVKDRATVSVYSGQDPIGTNTAYSVTATSQFGSINPTLTTVANGAYMIEFWARRDSGSNVLSVWANDNNTLIGTYSPTSTWTKYSFQFQRPLADTKIYPIQDRNASGFTPVQIWGINMYPLADVVQTTAASQPLLLAHTGENYWWGSGVAGNFVATASQSALKFNTDFSVVVNIESYIATTNMEIAGSSGGVAAFAIMSTGLLRFDFGGVGYSSTTTLPSNTKWIRFSASGLNLLFYTSNDGTNWTQLGTTVIMSARTTPGNIEIFAGRGSGNIALPLNGKIISIKYYTDSALASLVYNFNPASYNPSVSQTQWSSATGEVWSISTGTATSGYKSALVDRSLIQADGVDDKLNNASISFVNGHFNYCAYTALVEDGSGNRVIYNGSASNFINTISSISTNSALTSLTSSISGGAVTKLIRTLGLTTSVFGTNITKTKVNNGTFGSTLTGTYVGGAGYTLFAAPTTHFGNSIISTNVITNGGDTTTQQTAMYNAIRGFDNNAY